jgi:hypothetical protein
MVTFSAWEYPVAAKLTKLMNNKKVVSFMKRSNLGR